jgi:hypothetical protein
MASGGLYLFRRLEQLLPGVVSKRYRRLRFYEGQIVPVVPDLQAGAAEVVREYLSEVGDAALISDGAVDIPVVDISSDEVRYRVFMYASAFSYTMQQMRAIEFAGNAAMIDARKQRLAMRSIAERVNAFGAFGSAAHGVTGFMNNDSVSLENSSTNLWALTPDELKQFFMDWAATVSKSTSGAFDALDVVVSHDINTLLTNTRLTDSQVSVKQHILQSSDYIQSISWVDEAAYDNMVGGTANKDRIAFYPFERLNGEPDPEMAMADEPEACEMHAEPVQLAPQEYWETKNLRTVVPMFMCVSPAIINYPDAFQYVDVPKKP